MKKIIVFFNMLSYLYCFAKLYEYKVTIHRLEFRIHDLNTFNSHIGIERNKSKKLYCFYTWLRKDTNLYINFIDFNTYNKSNFLIEHF